MKTNVCYQGDSFELIKEVLNNSINLILIDPPYGMSFVSNYRKEKYNKINNDSSLEWLPELSEQLFRILKDNSHAYVFCSFHNIDKFKQEFEKYFTVKNILIWEKNNTSMGDLFGDYAPKYEMILYLNKGRRLLNNGRDSNIIKFNRTGNKFHPTEKPVDMFEYLINKSTNENDIVLDCFAGSGTTGVACKNTNRNFILIEQDEKYCEVIKERVGCEIIKPENPTDCLTDEFKDTGKYYGEGVADKLIELQKEKQELIKQVLDKCPKCSGRLVKTKLGYTCEDCMEDYN